MTAQTPKSIPGFHPELEALFDTCQAAPLQTTHNEIEYALMSVNAFEVLLKSTHFEAQDIKFKRVDREDKPSAIIMRKSTFDNLSGIVGFFAK